MKQLITDQDIDDILCAAFEGGINYWVSRATVKDDDYKGAKYASDVVSKGGEVALELSEDYAGEVKTITRERIIKGIELAAEHQGYTPRRFLDEHDAGSADNAVQFAVFGKLIFG